MRVLLSMYGSCGDVEPQVGLAVQLRVHGAAVRVCALVHGATTPSAGGVMAAGGWR